VYVNYDPHALYGTYFNFFSDFSATEMEARMQLLYFLKAQMKELSVDVEAFDPPYFLQTSIMRLRKKNETGR
jgi:hypothetical protein